MSQAEELLNILSENIPEHTHSMADADNAFVIDPVTRTIKNMTSGPLILMQRYHKSSIYTFKLPRYIDGHDMSLCNRVKCHFNNIEVSENTGETFEHADEMELTDLRVDPEDENSVICSWTIPRQGTWYAGALGFLLQFVCVDDAGNETYEWHTDEFTDVVVKKGRNNDYVILEYSAIFEQWRERIFGAGDSVKSELIALTEEKIEAIKTEGTTWVEATKSEGAKQVESVNTTGAAQVEAIANEGLRVFNTIPEDYTAMSGTVDMLTKVTGPVIRQEVEGEMIAVNDSAKMPLLGLQMFGKSEQVTTKGYQLFDASSIVNSKASSIEVLDNGRRIEITGAESYAKGEVTVDVSSLSGKTIYLKGTVTGGKSAGFSPYKIKTDGTRKWVSSATFQSGYLIEDDVSSILLMLVSNNTGDALESPLTAVFEDVMMYIDGDGTWEPFSGGKPSPNPEYPQDIVNINNRNIMVCGKNLWNHEFDKVDLSSVSGWGNQVWNANSIQLVLKPNTKYTLSFDVTCLSIPEYETLFDDTVGFNLYSGKSGGKYLVLCSNKSGVMTVGETRHAEQSFTTPSNIDDLSLDYNILRYTQRFIKSDGTPVYATVKFENIQLEIGDVATEYEKFIGGSAIAEIELPGLPVESGGNYIDENGQQYITNYRDWERGVDVELVHEITIDGDSPIHKNNTDNSDYIYYMYITDERCSRTIEACLCNRLRIAIIADMVNGKNQENCGFHINALASIAYFNVGYYLTENNINAVKALLADKPLTAQYVLETPIETPIPEAELQVYRELHTNYPNTTILNDSEAYMKLAYATDTKMYIDNKFAELQALIKES